MFGGRLKTQNGLSAAAGPASVATSLPGVYRAVQSAGLDMSLRNPAFGASPSVLWFCQPGQQ